MNPPKIKLAEAHGKREESWEFVALNQCGGGKNGACCLSHCCYHNQTHLLLLPCGLSHPTPHLIHTIMLQFVFTLH